MKRVIWWIRRDLRISDNPRLSTAISMGDEVIPIFILDPILMNSDYTSEKRKAFLLSGLRILDSELRKNDSYLIIREGNAFEELSKLTYEYQVSSILAEPDYSTYSINRDKEVASKLPVYWIGSPSILPPGSVLKSDGTPYTVFTPFSKAWKSLTSNIPIKNSSSNLPIFTPLHIPSLSIPTSSSSTLFKPGEDEAQHRLSKFTQIETDTLRNSLPAIFKYNSGRNQLDVEGTSQLSPYLRFGMLSARQALFASEFAIQNANNQDAQMNAESWLNELIWRDFYIHILHHFPHVRRQNFRKINIKWEYNSQIFEYWANGETGYPIIDASMRQLIETGWMHNRARMIVASFLTKDLLIDWRWGEKWFMQHLIDGDPAANNGGWQWIAGTGTDAAPFFRIFNPIHQAQKFDPKGNFVRKWLPELQLVPNEYIHEPWKMPSEIQRKSKCVIGKDYPAPIIDHYWARQRTLQVFHEQNLKNFNLSE